MLEVAALIARRYGFIEIGQRTINAERDKFWGNICLGIKARMEGRTIEIQSCKYIYPQFEGERNEKQRSPKIEIDMHFGNPRLCIDLPDGTSCFITYKDNTCIEVHTFGENGVRFAMYVTRRIDTFIYD